MCLGAMSGGVRGARWTQIDAIARADVPCRHVEWRLPYQMNCRKAWNRALTAVRGRLGFFLQIIARADMPCRPLEWRLPCQMNCRKVWDRALTAVCGSSESFRQIIARADMPWSDVWRGPRPDGLPESERPGSAPAATLSQCSVATRVCLSWNKDFQLPRRYN